MRLIFLPPCFCQEHGPSFLSSVLTRQKRQRIGVIQKLRQVGRPGLARHRLELRQSSCRFLTQSPTTPTEFFAACKQLRLRRSIRLCCLCCLLFKGRRQPCSSPKIARNDQNSFSVSGSGWPPARSLFWWYRPVQALTVAIQIAWQKYGGSKMRFAAYLLSIGWLSSAPLRETAVVAMTPASGGWPPQRRDPDPPASPPLH